MSWVTNISGGPLDVPLLDRIVEDGETVEVPDVQSDGESPIVWPSNRWEPAEAPQAEAPEEEEPAEPAKSPSGKDKG